MHKIESLINCLLKKKIHKSFDHFPYLGISHFNWVKLAGEIRVKMLVQTGKKRSPLVRKTGIERFVGGTTSHSFETGTFVYCYTCCKVVYVEQAAPKYDKQKKITIK